MLYSNEMVQFASALGNCICDISGQCFMETGPLLHVLKWRRIGSNQRPFQAFVDKVSCDSVVKPLHLGGQFTL